jgi:kynurenine formamidase
MAQQPGPGPIRSISSGVFADTIMIDLTHPLHEGQPLWPGDVAFRHCVCPTGTNTDGSFIASGDFTCAEHAGTHVDAPCHFDEHGATVDALSLTALCGRPVRVIDVCTACAADPNYAVTAADVERHEAIHGPISAETIVLFWTGWGERYTQPLAYFGTPFADPDTPLVFPGLGRSCAEALVARRVTGVGLDTPSLDCGANTAFDAHRILLTAGIFGIENVAPAIGQVPPVGASLLVLPLKLRGGTGAPARVVAVVPVGGRAV